MRRRGRIGLNTMGIVRCLVGRSRRLLGRVGTLHWFRLGIYGFVFGYGYHDAHNHPNCSWCGIYCIEKGNSNQKNQNGINRFHSPLNSSMADAGNYYLQAGAWDWEPKDGHLLVFPSYLMHSALPYNGDIDRIIMSFNSTTVEQQEAI